MVVGSLRSGQMPPREIFDWFADFTTQGLIETEKRVLEGQTDADIAADLERYVVSLSEVMRICDANSLLGDQGPHPGGAQRAPAATA